ncbi:hypothetical protein JKL49_05940 [Phenylobacterium sp. 20VBR1]|nr:hypothetical protein [Phenylobacterium glaciei]MBR7618925.1 hypothetical protein [Phenylobacterium glaciei]
MFTSSKPVALAPILQEPLEASAGILQGGAANDAVTGDPLPEPAPAAKPTLREQVRKHPVLAFALGGLVIGGIAAIAGRGAIARTARPLLARAARPVLIRAVASRPLQAAGMALRHPRATARWLTRLR